MYYDKERFDKAFMKFLHEFVWSTETLDGFNGKEINAFINEMSVDETFKDNFTKTFMETIDNFVIDKQKPQCFHVTNIVWDMTDSQGDASEDEDISLPNELDVYCFDESEIADTLSDDYGFCVKSYWVEY